MALPNQCLVEFTLVGIKGLSINSNVHHNPNNVRIDSDPLHPPLNPNSQNIEIKMVLGGKCRIDPSFAQGSIDRTRTNDGFSLRLYFRQYPAIHTNYS